MKIWPKTSSHWIVKKCSYISRGSRGENNYQTFDNTEGVGSINLKIKIFLGTVAPKAVRKLSE